MFRPILLICLTFFADLYAQASITYHTIKQHKSVCTNYNWNDTFCSSYTLTTPYTKHIKHKDIKALLDSEIEKLDKMHQDALRDYANTIDELSPDENNTGHYYLDKILNIFAFTPATITLILEESTYTGGAHGSYDIYYDNYDLKTQKKLNLRDILKPNSYDKFVQIAQDRYKKTYHIPQNATMEYDGWFNEEFVLASNFAIKPEGIYFLYNSYEIKPYADGQTTLLVPYKDIKHILNPKYFTSDFFNKLKAQKQTINKTFSKELSVHISPLGSDKLLFEISAYNDTYDTKEGWLSITFVGCKDVITSHIKSNFQKVDRYPNGIPIYYKPTKKTIKKHSVLLEAYDAAWESDSPKTLSFVIQKPKNHPKLEVQFRVVFKDKQSHSYSYIPKKDAPLDQQGFHSYKVEIDFD
jgi:hypothetical protein